MQKNNILVFSTLAEYQTEFWLEIAKYLHSKGERIIFLSFDDKSSLMLEEEDFKQFNIPLLAKKYKNDLDIIETFNHYNVTNIQQWINHERVTFNIFDSQELMAKFSVYLNAVNEVISEIKKEGRPIVIQEFGGFLSVISIYIITLHHQFKNWFIEPSFFRGKLFYNLNTFASTNIQDIPTESSLEVKKYLTETITSRSIVIPKKDIHQYNTALIKVANFKNFKKLIIKIFNKHILRRHQEFGYILRYVTMHLSQAFNSICLRKYYLKKDLKKAPKYVYFPLHVPGDAALTLRSPKYLDQISLIEYLARNLPIEVNLFIKEHPAQIGAIQRKQIISLLRQYDNLKLIHPSKNNFELLENASCVISINSKSGAEAIALGKKVIVLGDAFYSDSHLVTFLNDLSIFNETIKNLLADINKSKSSDIENYFQAIWDKSSNGELYDLSSENIKNFSHDLLKRVI